MKTVILPDKRRLTYELTRKSVKNINFRPKEDGIVYVSASPRVSIKYIEQALAEKADFFFEAFEKLKKREEKSSINTKSINWLGKQYPVRIIKNARECAVIDENECRVFTAFTNKSDYVQRLIILALSERFLELCREINAEVLSELERNGLKPPPTVITIKDMKSRWGSCSYDRGHISINGRLAAYPRDTIKAVFWHEYAHYWYHDHSERFYDFLRKNYPDYFKWHEFLKE